MLVLARQESLDGLEDVRKENLQLLQEMHNVGLKWVDRFQNEDASLIFRLGYHSVLESAFTFRALMNFLFPLSLNFGCALSVTRFRA